MDKPRKMGVRRYFEVNMKEWKKGLRPVLTSGELLDQGYHVILLHYDFDHNDLVHYCGMMFGHKHYVVYEDRMLILSDTPNFSAYVLENSDKLANREIIILKK